MVERNLSEIKKKQQEWEDTTLRDYLKQPQGTELFSVRQSVERTTKDVYDGPNKLVYTPKDLEAKDYLESIGFPGQYPFTRGIDPAGYRDRLWLMSQYAGFGLPEQTNARWKVLFEAGNVGLIIAPDLLTQMGYDSDHPNTEGEVGVVGVAIPTLKEMEVLFNGIPMDRVNVSTPMCHAAIIHWAHIMAAAEKQGVPSYKLSGRSNTDVLSESLARGNSIFAIKNAMRLDVDLMEYSVKHIPYLMHNINGYAMREAGCTTAQEGAFVMATIIEHIDAALERGIEIDDIAPRFITNSACYMDFFESIAKFRALRRLWARIMKERYKAKNPASLKFRHGGPSGCSDLTAQQPENNIVRLALMVLEQVLSGSQWMATMCYEEGHALPTERAAILALRTQQILAYETGVRDVVDPLGGSYYVEALTDKIEEEIVDYL
ncbi:MAG: methylmalonyl-CoA mutase, partial [Chloroflexi bacterium]|nr:methylmalonyl-CoA mutase [Chloroflexota bacterium]